MSSARSGLSPADLAAKTVAIVGVGREGVAVARALQRDVPTATLVAIDQREGDQVDDWRAQFDIPLHIVDASGPLPPGIDVAVVSPGFAPHNPVVELVDSAGIVRTSGTDLFFSQNASRIIGVTGSKGKSTTSALIHHLLRAHGLDAVLGGNVGVPLWDLPDAQWIVAEVSSFQASSLSHSPHTAVLTALFDEHRDWHGSFDAYVRDKLKLVAFHPDHLVVNSTQPTLVEQLDALPDVTHRINVGEGRAFNLLEVDGREWLSVEGEAVIALDELPLAGRHNAWNALLALAAVSTVVSVDPAVAAEALRTFEPLPHRLQPVSDPSAVEFLNDSLATNPPALAAALGSLRDRRVIAIIGGADRGVDQSVLRDEIVSHPPAVLIGLPDSGPQMLQTIAQWLTDAGVDESHWPARIPVDDMSEAVSVARAHAESGNVVVLSPGAPSFGRYRDYQDRAEQFIAAVAATAEH